MTETLPSRLQRLVGQRAATLAGAYRANVSSAVAALALLRRGVGERPGSDPRIIALTVADVYESPERLPDRPLEAETAAHAAMTLFGVHQQSHRDASMHRNDYGLGRSTRLLLKRTRSADELFGPVHRRFTALATATTFAEATHHARGLVQQLRAESIPLDYGRFARDLYFLQFSGERADGVRLAWGRQFYRETDPTERSEPGPDAPASTDEEHPTDSKG